MGAGYLNSMKEALKTQDFNKQYNHQYSFSKPLLLNLISRSNSLFESLPVVQHLFFCKNKLKARN